MARILVILSALLLTLPGSAAGDINGIHFDERRTIAGTELQLTGTAMLTWAAFFDVYAGGSYLPPGHSGSRWTEDVPKMLELSYLRNFKAEDFSSSSDKLLRESLPPKEYQRLAERLGEFYQFFRDIRKGDRYSLVYHPSIGTELRLNGVPLGRVHGHDFAVAYFGIWLGPQPISESFRDRLLNAQ